MNTADFQRLLAKCGLVSLSSDDHNHVEVECLKIFIDTFGQLVEQGHTDTTRSSKSPESVYFIQAGESGLIKVGYSDNVAARLSALQTSNPIELVLLGAVACPDAPKVERLIHARLNDLRMEGEWFRQDQRVHDELANLTRTRVTIGKVSSEGMCYGEN